MAEPDHRMRGCSLCAPFLHGVSAGVLHTRQAIQQRLPTLQALEASACGSGGLPACSKAGAAAGVSAAGSSGGWRDQASPCGLPTRPVCRPGGGPRPASRSRAQCRHEGLCATEGSHTHPWQVRDGRGSCHERRQGGWGTRRRQGGWGIRRRSEAGHSCGKGTPATSGLCKLQGHACGPCGHGAGGHAACKCAPGAMWQAAARGRCRLWDWAWALRASRQCSCARPHTPAGPCAAGRRGSPARGRGTQAQGGHQ